MSIVVGKAYRIRYKVGIKKKKVRVILGVCIAIKKNRVKIRNIVKGIAVEWTLDLFSPVIEEVKELKAQRSYSKRSKLYYLRDKRMSLSLVKGV